jgi:5-methylcytosine-specific restriction endonuclease McrA
MAWPTAEQGKDYYRRNRERLLAAEKARYQKNKERLIEYRKAYNARNVDAIAEYQRQWQKDNRDRCRASTAKWDKANPGNRRAIEARYRGRRQRQHVENVDPLLVLANYHECCGICGDILPVDEFHLDHIVPLSKGGRHLLKNLQPACPPCNLSKGDRWPTLGELEAPGTQD